MFTCRALGLWGWSLLDPILRTSQTLSLRISAALANQPRSSARFLTDLQSKNSAWYGSRKCMNISVLEPTSGERNFCSIFQAYQRAPWVPYGLAPNPYRLWFARSRVLSSETEEQHLTRGFLFELLGAGYPGLLGCWQGKLNTLCGLGRCWTFPRTSPHTSFAQKNNFPHSSKWMRCKCAWQQRRGEAEHSKHKTPPQKNHTLFFKYNTSNCKGQTHSWLKPLLLEHVLIS